MTETKLTEAEKTAAIIAQLRKMQTEMQGHAAALSQMGANVHRLPLRGVFAMDEIAWAIDHYEACARALEVEAAK